MSAQIFKLLLVILTPYLYLSLSSADASGKAEKPKKESDKKTSVITTENAKQSDQKTSVYTKELAKKIVDDAESLRAFDSATSKVTVMTTDSGGKTTYSMNVLQAKDRRAYLEFTGPAEEVNRRMLAIKTSYWSKFPDSNRVVPISRREAIGNSAFAIADVFQMDTVSDYDPEIIGEESVDGALCYIVELKAKHNDTPYHKIVYAVRKKDHYPINARFFGASGKLLKTMLIEKSGKLAGRIRPQVLRMNDEATKNKYSVWTTLTVKKESIPDSVFTQAYLKSR